MTDDTLKLYVTLGHPGDGSLNLRMSPSIADEVRALLDEHDLAHGELLEFSSGPQLAIEAVVALGAGGGLAALASVINTMIKRHDSKRFVIERDGERIEASGYSEEAVDRLLEKRAQEQADQDKEWERIKAELPAPETPRDHQ
ncbi:hypothetical protein [Nocardioides panzhihuensis]|uniref:Uncharacterized protein n=1 Tax=Nocardioides panzhihuensis TaxID=860243 RepID=A0A7Z0IVY7_9ACTN|nr:hypothetical protein [Nocardioides panzhihuensis]NYI81258.1 hypothetical protein [Nocardioides panzhihuensis]